MGSGNQELSEEGGMSMDCFNFGCPFRVNETSSCNYCGCLACQNLDSHEYTIISNRTLNGKEIVETKAQLDPDYRVGRFA